MRGRFLAFVVVLFTFFMPLELAAADICHVYRGGQYVDETRTCVTSALRPQGGSSYGPARMAAESDDGGAWCEGVSGPGIGQIITLHQKPAQKIGSMVFVNGYAKTPETWRANGRVKRVRIETSGGYRRTATLKDTSEWEDIKIPPSKISWVRLTILETYPGDRHSDTCISKLYFNHEEFGALEEPRDNATPAPR